MLLPLLGACAVVGPFQGPEWEPVRGLLTENHSCRDPRCCGNLLVLCLFLIWQVRHYWHQVTRTTPSTRRVTKVRRPYTSSSLSTMIVSCDYLLQRPCSMPCVQRWIVLQNSDGQGEHSLVLDPAVNPVLLSSSFHIINPSTQKPYLKSDCFLKPHHTHLPLYLTWSVHTPFCLVPTTSVTQPQSVLHVAKRMTFPLSFFF